MIYAEQYNACTHRNPVLMKNWYSVLFSLWATEVQDACTRAECRGSPETRASPLLQNAYRYKSRAIKRKPWTTLLDPHVHTRMWSEPPQDRPLHFLTFWLLLGFISKAIKWRGKHVLPHLKERRKRIINISFTDLNPAFLRHPHSLFTYELGCVLPVKSLTILLLPLTILQVLHSLKSLQILHFKLSFSL